MRPRTSSTSRSPNPGSGIFTSRPDPGAVVGGVVVVVGDVVVGDVVVGLGRRRLSFLAAADAGARPAADVVAGAMDCPARPPPPDRSLSDFAAAPPPTAPATKS